MTCLRCGFKFNCICAMEPQLQSAADFVLLTHARESSKDTNTGILMTRTLPSCRVEMWHRTQPPQALLNQLQDPSYQAWLVFPSDEQHLATPLTLPTPDSTKLLLIIIDATWQEARKMVRKSPWLNQLPRIALIPENTSSYSLRRNQQPGHLCTCEVGIELLKQLHHPQAAQQLQDYFTHFIEIYHADKSGHAK
ncbi:tRNA-uridine aminocarboxypropyltransferase [Photobacterium aquimaris]|uniref:tRNA-uridine aminocarboxypropyltransferase n=1 Tax=Photobacterium aquimaris TaxID=512643 RepID=A0A2T3I1K9_9GAMM|nr:DTW domain-containing protein [Photobacterium aquimaris]MCP4955836.1 DTW domain-containing protein [Photobacterium aquimaris]OBU16729.1 DTW domain-containing protein [Photobacterium aquimaris]PQJ37437.1 DTW domain-containing protein [Photobacterium aquimaris]PSU11833.1 DTW domain-containing protein [Photobacterium aquimaris]